jgi:hypothetical protein
MCSCFTFCGLHKLVRLQMLAWLRWLPSTCNEPAIESLHIGEAAQTHCTSANHPPAPSCGTAAPMQDVLGVDFSGSTFVAVSGHDDNPGHLGHMLAAAEAMLGVAAAMAAQHEGCSLAVRLGLHTGPIATGTAWVLLCMVHSDTSLALRLVCCLRASNKRVSCVDSVSCRQCLQWVRLYSVQGLQLCRWCVVFIAAATSELHHCTQAEVLCAPCAL